MMTNVHRGSLSRSGASSSTSIEQAKATSMKANASSVNFVALSASERQRLLSGIGRSSRRAEYAASICILELSTESSLSITTWYHADNLQKLKMESALKGNLSSRCS